MSEFACNDCSIDTVEINERYMVTDDLWITATLNDKVRYLCVGCLETRLSKVVGKPLKLNMFCFNMAPINHIVPDLGLVNYEQLRKLGYPFKKSERLKERLRS